MPRLRCYRLMPQYTDVDEFFDDEAYERWGVVHQGSLSIPGAEITLYLGTSDPKEPEWMQFLRSEFPGLPDRVGSGGVAGVLFARLRDKYDGETLAFTFGAGYHLLKRESFVRAWGLKVALNALSDPALGTSGSLLKSLDVMRLAADPLKIRSQAPKELSFDGFDLDSTRHIIRSVTGKAPGNADLQSSVTGSDSFSFSANVGLSDLDQLGVRLLDLSSQNHYKGEFSWIDDIQHVMNPAMTRDLEQQVFDQLTSGGDALELAIPGVVDWAEVDHMQFHFDRRSKVKRPDIRLLDYLRGEPQTGPPEFAVEKLRHRYLYTIGSNGEDTGRWSIWECLSGEVLLAGDSYILDSGEFYRISSDYLEALNDSVQSVERANISFPNSRPQTGEAAYLQSLCKSSSDFLLMDRALYEVAKGETKIEICDLIHPDGILLHAKRHFSSSNLSHLFAQGVVSAEALVLNREHRSRVASGVEALADAAKDSRFAHIVSTLKADRFSASDHCIGYVIIGDWSGKSLSARLPFFSKVALRTSIANLHRMGFQVACYRVEESRF